MDTQRLLKYTAAVISEFSLAHNLTLAQAVSDANNPDINIIHLYISLRLTNYYHSIA